MYSRLIIIVLVILGSWSVSAQTIKDPGFDSVYIGGIDRILHWIPSSAPQFYVSLDTVHAMVPDSCYDWLDPMLLGPVELIYNGAFNGLGLKLKTTSFVKEDGTPFETFLVNGSKRFKTGPDGYVDLSKSGEPFTSRPEAMEGWYQFHDTIPQTLDSGKCVVLLKKYNASLNRSDTIAYSSIRLGPATSWSEFNVPLNYVSNDTPDSIVVVFMASTNPLEYGELWLDELSFINTTSSLEGITDLVEGPIVYPNPNSGIVFIKEGVDYKHFKLFSVDGQLLRTGRFVGQLDVSDIALKVFVLQLMDGKGGIRAFRVLKE